MRVRVLADIRQLAMAYPYVLVTEKVPAAPWTLVPVNKETVLSYSFVQGSISCLFLLISFWTKHHFPA